MHSTSEHTSSVAGLITVREHVPKQNPPRVSRCSDKAPYTKKLSSRLGQKTYKEQFLFLYRWVSAWFRSSRCGAGSPQAPGLTEAPLVVV